MGGPPKVLEAYMGEVVWPHPPKPNGIAFMGIGQCEGIVA